MSRPVTAKVEIPLELSENKWEMMFCRPVDGKIHATDAENPLNRYTKAEKIPQLSDDTRNFILL